MNHLDLFSGIGGFALAARWAGMKTIGFVEIDEYCQKVLRKHWPDVKIISDIHDVKEDTFEAVDIITGGFPCQPFSVAGKQKGKEDDRYLWPAMLDVIKIYKPTWVLGENVAGIIKMELPEVLSSLENEGYETQSLVIPACAVNSPHRRDRVWIVAYSERLGRKKRGRKNIQPQKQVAERQNIGNADTKGFYPDSNSQGLQGGARPEAVSYVGQPDRSGSNERTNWKENWYEVAAEFCRVGDGIPNRVDRLKALGNAIVPQVTYEIMKGIMDIHEEES